MNARDNAVMPAQESADPASSARPSAPRRLRPLGVVALVCSVIVLACAVVGIGAPLAASRADTGDGSGGMFAGAEILMAVSALTLVCLGIGVLAQVTARVLDVVLLALIALIALSPPIVRIVQTACAGAWDREVARPATAR